MSKDNFSLDQIMRIAKASQSQKPEDMLGAIKEKLPDDKVSEIQRVLKDKKALEQLLNSEQAQRIMNRFKK
jgi:hypothetical protein